MVASRTFRTALLVLQVSAERSVGWMTSMPSSPPIRPIQIGPQGAPGLALPLFAPGLAPGHALAPALVPVVL